MLPWLGLKWLLSPFFLFYPVLNDKLLSPNPIVGSQSKSCLGPRCSAGWLGQQEDSGPDLARLKGQGRFNDARSLRKGSSSMRKKMLPIYLRAAELATAYYSDERDFTAFDADLGLD